MNSGVYRLTLPLYAVSQVREKVSEYGREDYYCVLYPVRKLKKLFRLMVENCEESVLDEVQSFLEKSYKKFAKDFISLREKYGR